MTNNPIKQTPISVFIVTLNESQHIGEVIKAAQIFNEVIVVDSGSTDGTVDIAKALGAQVIHQQWLGFAKQKSFAMAQCRNQWVFNLDGDEILPAGMAHKIQELVNDDAADALRVFFEDIFWNRPMSIYSAKRSIIRVYKKDKVCFPQDRLVHENVVLADDAREINVPGLITHFGYGTTKTLMDKQNTYSSLKATEKGQKGKSPSLLKLALIFPLTFIKSYIFRRMFLSGKRGLVHAMIDSMYAFLKEAKLFEYQQQKDKH